MYICIHTCFITVGSKTFCEAEEDKACESDESNFEPDEKEEEATHEEDKENVSPKSVLPNIKKGKKKKQTGEFMLRTGKPPQRSVPLIVS